MVGGAATFGVEQQAAQGEGEEVHGLSDFLRRAAVPLDLSAAVTRDVLGLGAVNVNELDVADWTAMPSWPALRPLQQRRVLSLLR